MTVEEALKLVNIDFSKAEKDEEFLDSEKDYDITCVFFGYYQNERLSVYNEGDYFVISLGLGKNNFKVYKSSGTVEEFKIIVR